MHKGITIFENARVKRLLNCIKDLKQPCIASKLWLHCPRITHTCTLW